jgi:hypothetical protein
LDDALLASGVDCDEVFPGILLGNGATVKKKASMDIISMLRSRMH